MKNLYLAISLTNQGLMALILLYMTLKEKEPLMVRGTLLKAAYIVVLVSFLGACGNKPKYQKEVLSASASAGVYTRPKIDIVMFQDTSQSMQVPIQTLQSQLNSFIDGIDSQWDFHFTVLPLQQTMSLNSKYIIAQDCSTITTAGGSVCLNPSQKNSFTGDTTGYAGFMSITTLAGNTDYGFTNMQANLSQASMTTTNFLRPDAALAAIVVTNGEDVSGVGYTTRVDGMTILDYASPTSTASFNSFKTFITTGLGKPVGLTTFYAIASTNYASNCYGGSTWPGKRYIDLANQTNGNSYDLCTTGSIQGALSNIRTQLASMIQAFVFNYIVLPDAPIVNSIVITKNGIAIPQNAVNGWTYEGYKSNTPIAISPAPSNNRTGFFIKMNGTAQYSGTDLINIDYQRQ